MEKSQEKKKRKSVDIKGARLAVSPLLLLQDDFTADIQDKTVKLSQDQVKDSCFEVLGLMEEYYREPNTAVDVEQTKERFEGTDKLDDYLELMEEEQPALSTVETPKAMLVNQHRDLIKNRIRELLAVPDVRNLLRTEFTKELKKFRAAWPKLKRLQRVQDAIEHATLAMHSTYLESKKKHHGVLVESAGKKIEKLAKIVDQAKKEEEDTIARANQVERGFIVTQELLAYKKQMAQKGFALTPSRRELLHKIVEHAMSGQKVYLVGSTGTGKTELAFYAVHEVTGEYEIIPWHEGTVMKDVMGQMQLAQNASGQVESSFKPGPLVRGYTKGRGIVHEEFPAGSTRTMMGMKPYLNLRPGQNFKIPEMNGNILRVDEQILMEIFTGNPKSEQTPDREDLDPAILRMMKGIQVEYMPPAEMAKIVVAKLMEESGLLKLSKSDVELIEKLAEAAHLMQLCHENMLEGEAAAALKQACGIDDLRITKNFLDSGSFVKLFAKYDYELRKGKSLRTYLQEQLDEFLHDPKNINAPEERILALGIFKLSGVLAAGSTLAAVKVTAKDRKLAKEKPYILPSEMGFFLGAAPLLEDEPFADEGEVDSDIENTLGEIKGMLGADVPEPATTDRLPEVSSNTLRNMMKFVDKYNLPSQAREKLKELFEGYDEAVATAREVDPDVEIKPFTEVCAAFKNLGAEKIKEIAGFGQPTILVTPKNSFQDKKASMDRNKRYVDANGKQQDDVWLLEEENSPYTNVATPAETEISVVDGQPHMPHIPGITPNSRWDDRKAAFKAHFAKKGLRLMNIHEAAVLEQRSLREYEANSKDVTKIVDYYQTGQDTVSCLDDEYLTNSSFVACSCFDADCRRVGFAGNNPDNTNADLRARPSVQILKY